MGTYTIEQIERLYRDLLEKFRSGQLTFEAFVAEVYKLQAQDELGNWWMIDPQSGNFIRFDGTQWVTDTPPRKPPASPAPKPSRVKTSYALWYQKDQGEWSSCDLLDEMVIGRQSDCELPISDARISRRHAKLETKADGIWLTDLGSQNGTYVEGKRLTPHQPYKLQPGQSFVIANATFRVEIAEPKLPYHTEPKSAEEPVKMPQPPPRAEQVPYSAFTLWYRHGVGEWRSIPLNRDLIIGRRHDCDVQITEETVSRQHARLSIKEGAVWLTDLGSSNGTFLMGERLSAQVPKSVPLGQDFSIGNTVFRVTMAKVPAPDVGGIKRQRIEAAQPKQEIRPVSAVPSPLPVQKGKGAGLTVVLLGGSLFVCFCAMVMIVGILFFRPARTTSTAQVMIMGKATITPISEAEKPKPSPTVTPEVKANQTWLVILYQVAEDKPLEIGSFLDVNESELVGGSDRVRIVTQFDRFKGGLDEEGGWTSAKRLEIAKDTDVERINSPEISDQGEVDSAAPTTFVEYVTWAIETYPADKYVLIVSDHGMGWVGALADDTPTEKNYMRLSDIEQALSYILQKTGIRQFDVLGFDACLMGQMEVFFTMAPYARYVVASEEVEPMLGWAYEGMLKQLVNNPDMKAADLVQAAVNSYIDQDIIVTNDYIRDQIFEGASAQDVAYEKGKNSTMSAVDSSRIAVVIEALDAFIASLQNADQSVVAWARTNAQHYEDAFMDEDTPLHNSSTIDLAHFAMLMKENSENAELSASADQLINAIQEVVVSEKHGPESPGSHGISIFFPLSEIYVATYDDTYSLCYTCIANTFAQNSRWPAFLEFHYSQ